MSKQPKLFDAPMHPELVQLLDVSFKNACKGKSDQFLHNIDVYLNYAPNAMSYFYSRGVDFLKQAVNNYKWKLSMEDIENLDKSYVAIMQLLHEFVFVGIDVTKDGFPSALYTRNITILTTLKENGMLNASIDDIAKLQNNLLGTKTYKGIDEKTHCVMRLDLDGVTNGKPVFKPTIPTSRLKIGVDSDFVFIPLPFYYHIEQILFDAIKDRPFKFTKTSVTGQVSHMATISADTVRKYYEGCDQNLIESKIRKTKVGYDVLRLRFMAYDLESSLNSIGSASFRPEMLDFIAPAKNPTVDKSQYMIDYNHLKGVFKTRVKGFKVAQFDEFKLMDTTSFANTYDRAEALINWANSLGGADLYRIMKQYENLFGDVDKALATREKNAPKVIKLLKLVDLSDDATERKNQISTMLKTGLVKMVMMSKKSNNVSEKLCSNNPEVLAKMLGKDYVAKFESIRHKVENLKELLIGGKVKDRSSLESLASEYGVLAYVDGTRLFSKAIEGGNTNPAISALDDVLADLNAKAKPRSESLITFRNVNADNEKEFYGSVHIDNILSVEYAPYEEKKKQ